MINPSTMAPPSAENNYYASFVSMIGNSLKMLTGKHMELPVTTPALFAKAVYQAPFALVSHDTSDDPVFNYANQTAQSLFEFSWEAFTKLPSRKSAEAPNREERAKLLDAVTHHGFIDNYKGVRISKTGKRFMIEQAIVWNIVDELGQFHGQAAMFDQIKPL